MNPRVIEKGIPVSAPVLAKPSAPTDPDELRRAFAHVPSGLAIVAALGPDDEPVTLPGAPANPESFRSAYGGEPLDDATLLARDGFTRLADAVGADHR